MSLQDTLGNEPWIREKEDAIKAILPQTWTHMNNINILQLMYQLKLIGVDWRSQDRFVDVMVFLEKIGILIRDGMAVRANPHSIFQQRG